jgi:pimeloyl-ACP methyl ester carboxylesterase
MPASSAPPVRRENGTSAWQRGAARIQRAAGRVAPGLAARVLEHLFFTPPRPRPSRGEAVLDRGERFDLPVEGRRVTAWRLGEGPAVLLLHGWGGRAGQLSAFVAPLRARGFSVVALDAPGHGASQRGRSSAPQFARALRAVAERTGAYAVVGHSLGAAGAALAVRDGLRVSRLVFLAPPAYPPGWWEPFAERLAIDPAVGERVRSLSERRLRMSWRDLHLPSLAAGRELPLLVIHDRDDRAVPVDDGRAVAAAWAGARLIETSGLGHVALLRDPGVVGEVAEFLSAGGVPAGRSASVSG